MFEWLFNNSRDDRDRRTLMRRSKPTDRQPGRFFRIARSYSQSVTARYDAAVQAKLGPPNTSEWNARIDAFTGLADTIAEVFRAGDRLPVSLAYCVECDIDPIFAAEHLDQRNIFTSVINLTFRQERS